MNNPFSTKRTARVSQVRFDPKALDQMVWIKAALADLLPDVKKISQSAIVRRALAMYTGHLERILTAGSTRGQLTYRESHHIQHHGQEQAVAWNPNGACPEFTPDGAVPGGFPLFTDLEKAHRKAAPGIIERLRAKGARHGH
jgi:hypothetical protein